MTTVDYNKEVIERQRRFGNHVEACLVARLEVREVLDYGSEKDLEELKRELKSDPVTFFDLIATLYDPRETFGSKIIPFVLFDFQAEDVRRMWDNMQNGGDIHFDKSRDMGATWVMCTLFVYAWCFWGYDLLVGSRKQDLVDKLGNTSSIFFKLVQVIKSIHPRLLPIGFDLTKHRKLSVIENPELGNSIMGEATNHDFSVGGRFRAILFDEFAKWDSRGQGMSEGAWNKARDATKCRIAVSTPDPYYGKDAMFYKLKYAKNIEITRVTWHWTKHPFKDKDWYDGECERTENKSYIAQELDINYEGAASGKVYPMFNQKKTVKEFELDPRWQVATTWDFSEGGDDPYFVIWVAYDPVASWYYIINELEYDHIVEWGLPFITGRVDSDKNFEYDQETLDAIPTFVGYRPKYHIGDPFSGAKRRGDKIRVVDVFSDYGIYMNIPSKNNLIKERIDSLTAMLPRITIHPRCERTIAALANSSWPKQGRNSTTSVKKPVHDDYSHARTALEYAFSNPEVIFPPIRTRVMPAGGTVYRSGQRRR